MRRPHFSQIHRAGFPGNMERWLAVEDALTALFIIIKDEINILRVQAGLPERTLAQVKNAVINKMDELQEGATE